MYLHVLTPEAMCHFTHLILTECHRCHSDIPMKLQKTGTCRTYQTGQICPYCFNTGFRPKQDIDRPSVTICPACNGEGEIRARKSIFLSSYRLCIACNGEKIQRKECFVCYKAASMGKIPCKCGSKNGQLPPHRRRISLAPFKRRGRFATGLKRHLQLSTEEDSKTGKSDHFYNCESIGRFRLLMNRLSASNRARAPVQNLLSKFVSNLPQATDAEVDGRISEWLLSCVSSTEDENSDEAAWTSEKGPTSSREEEREEGREPRHRSRRIESRDATRSTSLRIFRRFHPLERHGNTSTRNEREYFSGLEANQIAREHASRKRLVSRRDRLREDLLKWEPKEYEEGTYRHRRVVSWPNETETEGE
jgi:hypothetical protein